MNGTIINLVALLGNRYSRYFCPDASVLCSFSAEFLPLQTVGQPPVVA